METRTPPTAPPAEPAQGDSVSDNSDGNVLQLYAEDATIVRQTVESGRVRVSKVTRTRDQLVDEMLLRTGVDVKRIPVGREIEAIPEVKDDGELIIIPVVEETIVVQRQLVLKEELHIRRVQSTERYQETVKLRHQTAEVTRIPAQSPASSSDAGVGITQRKRGGVLIMAYETLVAAFDTKEHATAAVNALKAGGFHPDDISIFDNSRLAVGKSAASAGTRHAGLWHRLFGDDINKYEATVYGDTINEGGTVVSVRVPQDQVAQASGILDLHRPVNVHDRAVTSGIAPAAQVESAAKAIIAAPLAAAQSVAVTPKLAELHKGTLRLAEEQLQVGKKMVETGRTRVRRFTTEREVSQDVTLHEEHAEVLRKALADPTSLTNIDWADSEIEVVETAEQALVNKTARLVEEVSLRTKGDDHVETIHEKLRRQQAEIEQVDAAGKPIRRA
jgi:uncharacterized protein (TIGR02271 family)